MPDQANQPSRHLKTIIFGNTLARDMRGRPGIATFIPMGTADVPRAASAQAVPGEYSAIIGSTRAGLIYSLISTIFPSRKRKSMK